MTAEIAILNKTAVALATDSAITISAGQTEEKIFDSGDKLFELSCANPIGVMIYNDLQFAEIPLPIIIKDFRDKCTAVDHVEQAADLFLQYLDELGRTSSSRVQETSLRRVIDPLLERMDERFKEAIRRYLLEEKEVEPDEILDRAFDDVVRTFETAVQNSQPGEFVGNGAPNFTNEHKKQVLTGINEYFGNLKPAQKDKILGLFREVLLSDYLSSSLTGIVVSGFGTKDVFPTLVAYEVDGVALGRIKKKSIHRCDIDRDGERASVIPFAQKEMVDRFLYGLDDEIVDEITSFARRTISTIGDTIRPNLEFATDDGAEQFASSVKGAEDEFVSGLKADAFKAIRDKSKQAIEDIVEFMPKPEVARMAEALVELTSIKRRVSRGMETVREPIDVAVISRSEGFIWIKRKHYFEAEFNPRYGERLAERMRSQGRKANGRNPRKGKPARKRGQTRKSAENSQ
ncbi:hypothetical protein [Methyloceanibacter sp. wino2]|uniref:hypothetical protein n=1 Tax=Methyloceanibacter sp. wino2 TaxID=2170729 RepID=UPI000D3E3364|nr:hypothetical protein [Methyloceanibacter sp. wino2]